ncbi:hypothetical protein GCM10011610_51230 [Nocardia rhizosphaerihabitans]|uniref:Uncharacterized protein n=1 Tax=Nocardia rhizosphaerihabitans TaxID=1691570 RepID=A0ABQ2KV06_9NOCA|nr:hypothetical protein GCM10011610_51230 [Nocardia rhizosphaerihabitans]
MEDAVECLLVAVIFAAAVIGLDQLGLWAERRGWIYWRKSRGTAGAGPGMLAVLDGLFNPASEHVVEERESKQLVRVEAGSGRELDLDTRTVYLRTVNPSPADESAGVGVRP